MYRILPVLLIASLSGCGLIADAVSDATATEIDADLFPEMELGDAEAYVQPISFPVSVDQTNPTFSLPQGDTGAWGALISAHLAFAEHGRSLFEFSTENFSLTTTNPLPVWVRVFSHDDMVITDDDRAEVDVATCRFTLPANDDGTAYASNMETCLLDWVETNGSPWELGFEVTTGAGAERQFTGDYEMTNDTWMLALNNVEAHSFTRQLKVDGDVVDNHAVVNISDLGIESEAYWEALPAINVPGCMEDVDMVGDAKDLILYGYGRVDDTRAGQSRYTFGQVIDLMPEFFSSFYGQNPYRDDYMMTHWIPDMPEWMAKTLDIGIAVKLASVEGEDVEVPVRGFYIVAGHCPRFGHVNFKLTGTAKFDTE